MERTFATTERPASREPGALRLTQVALLIACLGAVLVLFDLFGLGVLGLFLAAAGTLAAAPGGLGKRWYWAVLIGAVLTVLSKPIADDAQTLGGWMAVVGAVTILVATALGFPTRRPE
jgi:hypothetical protein